MKKFSDSHEWVDVQNGVGTVGVTEYAQKELGDIVYVELPTVGKSVKAGEEAVVLESTKAAADVYSPISGEILEVNNKLTEASELVNESAETDGWLFKIKLNNETELDTLMDSEQYHKLIH